MASNNARISPNASQGIKFGPGASSPGVARIMGVVVKVVGRVVAVEVVPKVLAVLAVVRVVAVTVVLVVVSDEVVPVLPRLRYA